MNIDKLKWQATRSNEHGVWVELLAPHEFWYATMEPISLADPFCTRYKGMLELDGRAIEIELVHQHRDDTMTIVANEQCWQLSCAIEDRFERNRHEVVTYHYPSE